MVLVILLESVPTSLRGELTRWFVEPRSGVFVGNASALVRDLLWEKVCDKALHGGAIMVHNSNTEQGYAIRTHGETDTELVDWEGLWLFRKPLRPADKVKVAKEERAQMAQGLPISRGGDTVEEG